MNEDTALQEAKGKVMAHGVQNPTEKQYLGQLIITFESTVIVLSSGCWRMMWDM